jgi:hypothetical protein
MCWHFHKEQFKSVGKLRKVLAFADMAVKKVFASLEKCWHLLVKLLNKCWQA